MTSFFTYLLMKMGQSVPKRWHIKFRRWGITQKKTYNYRTAEVRTSFYISTEVTSGISKLNLRIPTVHQMNCLFVK